MTPHAIDDAARSAYESSTLNLGPWENLPASRRAKWVTMTERLAVADWREAHGRRMTLHLIHARRETREGQAAA